MKILYCITKSNFGGAQRYVFDLARHASSTHEVAVALGGTGAQGAEPGSLKTRLDACTIRTIVVPHFMRDMSPLDDIRSCIELFHIVRTERPDVLHVTSSKAGGIGTLIGRLCGVRTIIFTSHGLTFDEEWRPLWQRALIYCFTWLTILLSTRTIQISNDTYARARAMPLTRHKVTLIHNGIETPDLFSRDEARRTLLPHLPDFVFNAPWCGSIAELHPNKNLSVLIDALSILHRPGEHAMHLVLVGEGEERERLEERARAKGVADRVHVTGYVREAARYLRAFDLFVLPSLKEGLPYVLMEAGAASLPCIVSNIAGNTEIVTDGKTGMVVDSSPEAFAHAIELLTSNPELARSYGNALGVDRAKRFSTTRMVQDTFALYTTSVSAKSPQG